MGCGASNSGPHAFKASPLPTKLLRTTSTVNTHWVQHPFSPGAQRGELPKASVSSLPILYYASPHPSPQRCPSPPDCSVIPQACIPQSSTRPSLCVCHSVLRSSLVRVRFVCSWMQRPREADRGARHLHSTSRGCSDLTCNSSDKSLSAMPMAESVATLFVLISSEQISSSQCLAGSYRFPINVVTDFSRLGPGWGLGLGGKWRTGRRERCWPEADEENAGRITSGL